MARWRSAMLALASWASVSAQIPASPGAETPLQPNGPWVVETSEGACILTRSYGPDTAKVTIGLQPLFTTPRAELMVVTKDGSTWAGNGEATVTLSPGGTLTGTYASDPLTGGRRLTRLLVPSEAIARVRAAEAMRLTARSLDITVRLVRTAVAFGTFDRCQQALFRLWNLDPAALTPERAPTIDDAGRMFSPDQYPLDAQRHNIQGRVLALLSVGATGAVTDCRVLAPVHRTLDAVTCQRGRRLRFTPGKDAAGAPAASVYLLPVRWVLPR